MVSLPDFTPLIWLLYEAPVMATALSATEIIITTGPHRIVSTAAVPSQQVGVVSPFGPRTVQPDDPQAEHCDYKISGLEIHEPV